MTEDALQYELVSTPDWATAVRDSFRFEASGGCWDYVGACPRCGHAASKRLDTGGTTTYRHGGERRGELIVKCNCGSDHPGRPEGSIGCGAYAAMELEWE